jgi:hypothetical protein
MRNIFSWTWVSAVIILAVAAGEARAALYFSRDNNSQLYQLSTVNGAATLVGTTGVGSSTVGLTETNDPDILLGSTYTDLSRIKISTGTFTILGAIGGGGAEGLAWNPVTSTLYAIINTSFKTINANNGALISTLASAPADVEGLAYRQGAIYGWGVFGSSNSNLYKYTIATNTWSVVGDTGLARPLAGLAYDPALDTFYAKGSGDTNLYRINPVTAAVTVVGNTGISEGGGLAFTPEPSSALALLAALAGAGMSRRRIRRSAHGAATA